MDNQSSFRDPRIIPTPPARSSSTVTSIHDEISLIKRRIENVSVRDLTVGEMFFLLDMFQRTLGLKKEPNRSDVDRMVTILRRNNLITDLHLARLVEIQGSGANRKDIS